MSTVAIIDYGSGNLRSAAKAFEKVAAKRGFSVCVTDQPSRVQASSHIVLPGVGAFADCIAGLKAIDGMVDTISELVFDRNRPFLGICIGMQLLAEWGREHGYHRGLGWINGEVSPIPISKGIKVPHMGWNALNLEKIDHPFLEGINEGEHAYFVHSYHFTCTEEDAVLATVKHGVKLTAVLAKDNIVATQFHPEKSQSVGQRIIANFLKM